VAISYDYRASQSAAPKRIVNTARRDVRLRMRRNFIWMTDEGREREREGGRSEFGFMISLHLGARHGVRVRFDSRGRCSNAALSVNNDIRLLG